MITDWVVRAICKPQFTCMRSYLFDCHLFTISILIILFVKIGLPFILKESLPFVIFCLLSFRIFVFTNLLVLQIDVPNKNLLQKGRIAASSNSKNAKNDIIDIEIGEDLDFRKFSNFHSDARLL